MSNILKKFFPKDEVYQKFSYKDQRKLLNLIVGNVLCTALFIITSIFMFVIKLPITALLLFTTVVAFVLSCVFIKRGKVNAGSWFATVGYIMACVVISFFIQTGISIHVGYRVFAFISVMAILNSMVSLKPSQIMVFYGICQVMMFVAAFTVNIEVFKTNRADVIEVLIITAMGFLCGSLALYYTTKWNDRIVHNSEKEHDEVQKSLQKITDVLSKTKESLNIGEELNDAAGCAGESVAKINGFYGILIKEIEALTAQTANVKGASEKVNIQAGKIDEGISFQNNSLDETSSAITQISSNLSNINTIAEKRRQGMENVANIIKNQSQLTEKLVAEVENLKESSKRIENFVKTVDSIAGQTNLLAMNASIEAAHAGAMGKGFGVIAQEIRKLSEETTKNADKIAETLKENSVLVQNTINQVSDFANTNETNSEEIYSAVNAMEEILRGISEMDNATRDVMLSLQNVLGTANENGRMISDVVTQISAQNESIMNITNSTDSVRDRVNQVKETLDEINLALSRIKSAAIENKHVSSTIESLLD